MLVHIYTPGGLFDGFIKGAGKSAAVRVECYYKLDTGLCMKLNKLRFVHEIINSKLFTTPSKF